ncbi:MAG: tRNA (N6-threonylcarbamoyladenosine(37)-N6)-methyltransferase TrmO, partial [Bdellovibrionales bacterium]|nr:tRNA (N6-threonylcarbamoyladenosine(37)-N6)-methyltransferase TrmO [Bdellovibrionales bacterium]
VRPPLLQGEPLGVFATRTPHRPNPIGLSVVRVEKVVGDTLYLSGIDLIDGTPVLDIKPYIRAHDAIVDARDSYISERIWKTNRVFWSAEAEAQLQRIRIPENQSRQQIQTLVNQILEMDPRSHADKVDPERRDYYFITVFDDINVKFVVSGDAEFHVVLVENRKRIDPHTYPIV